jgi:hypothetical protein
MLVKIEILGPSKVFCDRNWRKIGKEQSKSLIKQFVKDSIASSELSKALFSF